MYVGAQYYVELYVYYLLHWVNVTKSVLFCCYLMASQIAMIETQSGSNRRLDVAFSKSRSKDDDERNILVTLHNVLQKQVWPLYRLFSVHVHTCK